jgi:ERCC4-type nuclease
MAPFRIAVDDREDSNALLRVLQRADDTEVHVRRLSVGDYVLDDRLLVERKTLRDFAVSVVDGRLFRQASRLASDARRGIVLLEGTSRDLADVDVRREALQGALVTLTLLLDLPLLRAKDPAESARLMLYAMRQVRRVREGTVPRAAPASRAEGKRATQLYVLQGLPNVGPTRAERLLDHFGSVEAVMAASADALTQVPSIGAETAASLRWAVEERRVPYTTVG